MFKKVALGVSGGVDSAVTAILLKSKGFNVTGVFMKNWDLPDELGVCQVDKDYEDAKWICDKLKIPLIEVNFVKEYWNEVFSDMLHCYETGINPNPDINCNKKIKFDRFFNYAIKELKADCIATGHYARNSFNSYLEDYMSNENASLLKAKDIHKDQTFFLSQISQKSLSRTMFPLGEHLKKDVFEIARRNGLNRIANKKESMGICFIGKKNFQNFIVEYIEDKPGHFIDVDNGRCVGEHNGIHLWTIGQRCKIQRGSTSYFVCRKDRDTNNIYVAAGTEHPALLCEFFTTSKVHWLCKEPNSLKNSQGVLDCEFKFERSQPLVPCSIFKTANDELLVRARQPQRAVTPGQYSVLYSGEECLGSAEISYCCPLLGFSNGTGK
ncbi:mitochondrial tRNA-specific 2-thiouridylase 1 [Copidosoma floridanum]|uniref:mitochondrial tRNA-specific 2-thiouridylase 1 n=1 Tax=Copidosoma floridanum TaxID=29053 RepID=UPI0006C9C0ED|nr:mitochondrial tRNA-specific 2-thiouridylase 1 [Copidosoma floridanum]